MSLIDLLTSFIIAPQSVQKIASKKVDRNTAHDMQRPQQDPFNDFLNSLGGINTSYHKLDHMHHRLLMVNAGLWPVSDYIIGDL